jgi:hypothetical protein
MLKRYELSEPNSCLNKAGENEMLFVLLARDRAAPKALRFWCNERIRLHLNDPGDEQIKEALACADAMAAARFRMDQEKLNAKAKEAQSTTSPPHQVGHP